MDVPPFMNKAAARSALLASNKRSVVFDGVDEIASAPHDSKHMLDVFSISFWIKGLVTPPVDYAFLVGKIEDVNWASGYGVFWRTVSGGQVSFFTSSWNGDVVTVNSPHSQNWKHIVAIANGTNLVLYIDNVKTVGPAYSTPITASTGMFEFMNGFTGYIGSGYIDECSYWNVALSDAEVAEIYNGGKPSYLRSHSKAVNLVSWWKMGDGDVHPILKEAIDGDHATMINMEPGDIVEDVP